MNIAHNVTMVFIAPTRQNLTNCTIRLSSVTFIVLIFCVRDKVGVDFEYGQRPVVVDGQHTQTDYDHRACRLRHPQRDID